MSADLNAIKARWAAATPGPWEAGDAWVYTMPIYPDDNRLSSVLGMKFEDPERREQEHARAQANAEAIAHAPEDIAALLTEVERLTKSVGAFSAARDAAKKGWQEANDKVARVEALAEDLDKKSTAAYESRYTEDWAYHEGRGDAYEESERLIRAALAEPTEHQ